MAGAKSGGSLTLESGMPAVPAALQLEGVTDCRKADGLPVYTVGQSTVEGLRKIISSLGARPGGPSHVVITDLREELVLYVNGTAYLRRELEMPAAALHHAGIQAAKLEDLERRLRADMWSEAAHWGGKVLLHREVETRSRKKEGIPEESTSEDTPMVTTAVGVSDGSEQPKEKQIETPKPHQSALAKVAAAGAKAFNGVMHHNAHKAPNASTTTVTAKEESGNAGGGGGLSGDVSTAGVVLGGQGLPSISTGTKMTNASTTVDTGDGTAGGGMAGSQEESTADEDITRTTDYQPTTQVAGFWESTGEMGDIDSVSRVYYLYILPLFYKVYSMYLLIY